MSRLIQELNIPEENKILLSKIEKRVSFLSERSNNYFDYVIKIASKDIERAYEVNEDLISILTKNTQLIKDLRHESFQIREDHQVNFTKEVKLDVSQEVDDISLIKNTLAKKEELISADDKHLALGKVKKYIQKGTKSSKKAMEESISLLEKRIETEDLLNIEPMTEDIKLIKKFINPKQISNTKAIYTTLGIVTLIILLLSGGGALWLLTLMF